MDLLDVGESGSMVMTSARAATSRGVSATAAPSRQLVDRRPAAAVDYEGIPRLQRFRAMGFPMMPRPMKPIVLSLMTASCFAGLFRSDAVA
jgi:hypothetical protein